MFRVRSLGGSIQDSVLALRGSHKLIPDDYFVNTGLIQNLDGVRMFSTSNGNSFHVDIDNVIFGKDAYKSQHSVNFEDFHAEFRVLWNVTNDILKMRAVRRIGLVGEFRFSPKDGTPSKTLVENLTTYKPVGMPNKFMLRFEDRTLLADGQPPNSKDDAFTNYIYHIYESSQDDTYRDESQLNANIDVQRYYAPAIGGNVLDELVKLKKDWDAASTKFVKFMTGLGLQDAKS
jgi:hypothetical protein